MALTAALNADSSAAVVTIPLLLIGLGMGALASQLGAVTVSAVPDSRSAEVGGIQNTVPTWAPPSAPPWPARS